MFSFHSTSRATPKATLKVIKLTLISLCTLGLICSVSSGWAKGKRAKKAQRQIKQVQKVLSKYTQKYAPLIQWEPSSKVIDFKGKDHTSILASKPVSQKAFREAFPQVEGLKGAFIQFLASQGFKQVKECLYFDPSGELSAGMWKKGRVRLYFTFSYTSDPKTHDQQDIITFFPKDLCGKS